MIKVKIILHSYLRELLPEEAHGQMVMEINEGACVRHIMEKLQIPEQAVCAVNDQIEPDRERVLTDGDTLRFLRPGAGG